MFIYYFAKSPAVEEIIDNCSDNSFETFLFQILVSYQAIKILLFCLFTDVKNKLTIFFFCFFESSLNSKKIKNVFTLNLESSSKIFNIKNPNAQTVYL